MKKQKRGRQLVFDQGRLEELFLQDEKAKERYRRKELLLTAVLAAAILGLLFLLTFGLLRKEESRQSTQFLRPPAGEGEREEEIRYVLSGQGQRFEVRQRLKIAAREYTAEEAEEYLDRAEEKIGKIAAGAYGSLSEVCGDLTLPQTVEGLPVTVRWKTDRNWFRSDGRLREDVTVTGPVQTTLFAELTCSGRQRVIQMPLTLRPAVRTKEELILEAAREEAEKAEKEQREEEYFVLPEQIGEYRVEPVPGISPVHFLLLLLPAGAGLLLLLRTRLERACRKRKESLSTAYPEFVDQLLLYVRAGLSVDRAWEMVRAGLEESGRYPFLAAEMRAAGNEMENGIAAAEALEHFGRRTGVLAYRRFAFLTGQNLLRGTRNLPELLEYECKEAMERQRNELQRKGEEAGTKLLFPMMLLLLIVLVLVLVPALVQL